MQVLAIDEIGLNWTDLDVYNVANHPVPEIVRDPGVHVSSLIKNVAIAKKYYTPEDANDEMPLRILLGMGWEWACARLYEDMVWQPGQFAWEGVTGSPDGFTYSLQTGIPTGTGKSKSQLVIERLVDEFKFTSKSLRTKGAKDPNEYKDITREWLWMSQVKSYLKIMSEVSGDPWRHARLHICWSCGAYTYPLTPRYFRYLIEFKQKELDDNWSYLKINGN